MPQMQSALTSFRLVPLRIVAPPRVSEKLCFPVPIFTAHAFAPAWASKVWLLLPEDTCTVPALVKRATTKMESDTASAPLGRPWKKFPVESSAGFMVLSVESQLADLSVGRYQ